MEEFKRAELIKLKTRLAAAIPDPDVEPVPGQCKAKSHQLYGEDNMRCGGCLTLVESMLASGPNRSTRHWQSQAPILRGNGVGIDWTRADQYLDQVNWCHQCCPKIH